jgi:hypothetical protein
MPGVALNFEFGVQMRVKQNTRVVPGVGGEIDESIVAPGVSTGNS